jgi:hypothetical protein
MRGYWADGTPFTKGGFGYNPLSTNTTKFAFGDDPNNSNGWSLCTADIPVGDKTFIMSVGPMLLQPGATNSLTMGIFSVSDVALPCPDLTRLKYAHDYIEHVLYNCFDTVHIALPACPNMNAIPGENELVLTLDNPPLLYLDIEDFKSEIPYVRAPFDSLYKFEGYKIYQVKNKDVLYSQLNNPEYARLIAQTDVKNGVKDIDTWKTVPNPNQNSADKFIWIPELAVEGSDKGIMTTFKISKDYFLDEDLINGKDYHYVVVSYAHNNWRPFDNEERYGQNNTYLESRRNFKVYTFRPKMISNIVDEDIKNNKVTIIPNPADSKSGTLNVKITYLPQSGLMSIYDSFGNLIETFDINSGQATFVGPKGAAFTYQLQNTVYKSGMYLIQIKDHDTGKVKVVKWMVI